MLGVYWWTLSYIKPYRWTLVLLVLSMIVASSMELAVPKFIQYFIDTIVPEGMSGKYYYLLVFVIGLVVILIAAQAGRNIFQRQLQERAGRDMQQGIFQHLRKLGFSYSERHPVGETLSFLNTEVGAVQNMYRNNFPWMLNGIVFSIIAICLMISSSLQLTAIVLPSFLIYYVFGPSLERKASVTGKMMANDRVELNRKAYESVSAQTELRAYGAERWDTERYAEKVDAYNERFILTYWYAFWRGTNRRLTYNLGGVFIFIYGYYLIGQQSLTVGEFVAFLLYYFTTMHRLTVVVTEITEQRVLMHQAKRLYDFMLLKPDVVETDNPVEMENIRGELQFRNVSFSYFPGQPVLEGFELVVPAGKRVAFVGTSGSGKSTALKLAGRFYDPSEGEIRLDGVPIDRLSFDSLRRSFGYVFQETYLFGASVRENIRFGNPDATDEEVEDAAIAACAHGFITAFPDGYDTLVGERGVKLSGGQKQRVAIARMFIKQPSVILLDEATSALDNISESVVQQALERVMKGKTILAVAHRLSTVQDFDIIVVLDQGRMAESGTYDELMAKRGILYRMSEGTASRKEPEHV